MVPILISEFCQRVNFADFAYVGQCLTEVSIGGDTILAGVLLSVMFVLLVMRYNFPMTLILPFWIALSYTLFLLSGQTIFLGFFMLSLMASGAVMIIGILKYINR